VPKSPSTRAVGPWKEEEEELPSAWPLPEAWPATVEMQPSLSMALMLSASEMSRVPLESVASPCMDAKEA
jgi:hypothetical protein